MDLYQEFERLIDALGQAGIEFAVCGGIAVALHGHVRATRDIDLLILSASVPLAMSAVHPLGFTLPSLPMKFDSGTVAEREVIRVSKVVGEDLLTLDLITLGAGLKTAWDTRLVLDWKGRQLQVVSRAGLALMKRVAGRAQDIADLERLGLEDE